MYEEYGPGGYGGTLDRELFCHNMRPPGIKTSHVPAFFRLSWPMLPKSTTYLPWVNGKNPGELRGWGIPIWVFAAVRLDKGLKDSAANRCMIPKTGFGFCLMLLKTNMK